MGKIANDIIDYNNKTSLLRLYLGYYDSDDIASIFDTDSVAEIIEKYTYAQIRARLINTKTLEGDELYNIGDIVELNKPVLKEGSYKHLFGLIIGKHIVFDEYNKNINPIYHYQYDILCIDREYIDGYSYKIFRERSEDLIPTNIYPIEGLEEFFKKFALSIIERPL